jgi:hypothetical protein
VTANESIRGGEGELNEVETASQRFDGLFGTIDRFAKAEPDGRPDVETHQHGTRITPGIRSNGVELHFMLFSSETVDPKTGINLYSPSITAVMHTLTSLSEKKTEKSSTHLHIKKSELEVKGISREVDEKTIGKLDEIDNLFQIYNAAIVPAQVIKYSYL